MSTDRLFQFLTKFLTDGLSTDCIFSIERRQIEFRLINFRPIDPPPFISDTCLNALLLAPQNTIVPPSDLMKMKRSVSWETKTFSLRQQLPKQLIQYLFMSIQIMYILQVNKNFV